MARMAAADRRRQLMTVALKVFSRDGYHGATMNDVADAAGVTKPVLYQHFPSKGDLYRELLADVSTDLAAVVTSAVQAVEPGRAQVRAGLLAYFVFVQDHRTEFRLLFGSGAQTTDEFAGSARDVELSMAGAIAQMVDARSTEVDTARFAHAIVGMAEGACRHWLSSEPNTDPAELADQLANMLWLGLGSIMSQPAPTGPAS